MPIWRQFGNTILTYLTRISSGYFQVVDPQNGYTAIKRETLLKINLDKIEKGFTFENDLLVKLHVCGAKVMNVDHPARYRGEKSKIKYTHFIVNTSFLLLKDFFWRLWEERIIFTTRKEVVKNYINIKHHSQKYSHFQD
jgi:hypothetical protein